MKGLVPGTALLLLMPLQPGPCLRSRLLDCVLLRPACRHPIAAEGEVLSLGESGEGEGGVQNVAGKGVQWVQRWEQFGLQVQDCPA